MIQIAFLIKALPSGGLVCECTLGQNYVSNGTLGQKLVPKRNLLRTLSCSRRWPEIASNQGQNWVSVTAAAWRALSTFRDYGSLRHIE